MSYYIYKYVKNNIIEYIGKTTNLEQRIKQHQKDKLKNFKGQIYYFECKNKTAMTSWEYTLINKYHPKYNAALKDNEINIDIKETEWILYMNTENKVINILDFLQPVTYNNSIKNNTISKPIVKNNKKISSSTTTIIHDPHDFSKRFTCRHCKTVFDTTDWYDTRTGYGAKCPRCSYAAWTK